MLLLGRRGLLGLGGAGADGVADPTAFLLAYEEAILEAGGNDRVMANWFPIALTGVPRMWLLHLPTASVASWGELRGLFLA